MAVGCWALVGQAVEGADRAGASTHTHTHTAGTLAARASYTKAHNAEAGALHPSTHSMPQTHSLWVSPVCAGTPAHGWRRVSDTPVRQEASSTDSYSLRGTHRRALHTHGCGMSARQPQPPCCHIHRLPTYRVSSRHSHRSTIVERYSRARTDLTAPKTKPQATTPATLRAGVKQKSGKTGQMQTEKLRDPGRQTGGQGALGVWRRSRQGGGREHAARPHRWEKQASPLPPHGD